MSRPHLLADLLGAEVLCREQRKGDRRRLGILRLSVWYSTDRQSHGAHSAGLRRAALGDYFSRLRSSTNRARSKYGCQVISGLPSRRQFADLGQRVEGHVRALLQAHVSPVSVMIPAPDIFVPGSDLLQRWIISLRSPPETSSAPWGEDILPHLLSAARRHRRLTTDWETLGVSHDQGAGLFFLAGLSPAG